MDTLEISLNQNPKDIAEDLEFWMSNLPQKLRNTPIIHLAIPGSHDSATYGITETSKVSPDAEPIIRKLSHFGPIFNKFMVKWSKTQTVTVVDQLKNGIRYFDLRIATKTGSNEFYFVHGVYSVEVNKVLNEVKTFLDAHPKEIIILDYQHFYAFTQSDHERLMFLIESTFGHRLLPYIPHMDHISLHHMTNECRHQIIVIYRSDAARFGRPLLWPSASFPTPWPDTVSIPNLMAFLIDTLKTRNSLVGFVSQCILTPTPWFITKHIFSCLKNQCLLPLEKEKYHWLRRQKPGRNGANIVISDFVDHNNGEFSRTVIGLNRKLLEVGRTDVLTPVDYYH